MIKLPTIWGIRVSALVEIAIFFMLLLPFSGFENFADIKPHPFWIIVILAALQYGINEGLIAALVASAILLIGDVPPRPENQYVWEYIYQLGITPILWVFSALIIGLFRDRQIKERDELRKDLSKARDREELIATNYKKVKEIKENLERRLAGEFHSSLAIYKAAQSIETLVPEAVINGVSDLVNAIMKPEKFSVYLMDDEGKLTLSTRFGWQSGDAYREAFTSQDGLYQSIVFKKDYLVISNEDDEKILGKEGFIAGPVIHPHDERVMGMLKIEELDFANLNLTSVGSFKALCAWLAMAYANAEEHERIKKEGILSSTQLLSQKYFERQSEFMTALATRGGFDLTLILIRIVNVSSISRTLRDEAEKLLSKAVESSLRKSDQVFQYRPSSAEYSILLPVTDEEGARKVLKKMMDILGEQMEGRLKKVQFSFSVKSLHKKEKGRYLRSVK